MLAQFTAWLLNLVREVFGACWEFLVDLFIQLLDLIVGGLVGLASAIPVPEFMSVGLQGAYAGLDPSIGYLLASVGLPTGLVIIGAGYSFRLVRKVVTLFQW